MASPGGKPSFRTRRNTDAIAARLAPAPTRTERYRAVLLGVTAGVGLVRCLAWLFRHLLLTLAFVLATRKDYRPGLPETREVLAPLGPAAVNIAPGTHFRPCLPTYCPVLKAV